MDQTVETVEVLARRRAVRGGSMIGGGEAGGASSVAGDVDGRERDWRAEIESRLMVERFEEAEVDLDHERGICWFWFRFHKRPSFTRALLRDVGRLQHALVSTANAYDAPVLPLKYVVWASRTPGVWNLGGDLKLFAELIRTQDRGGLTEYAYKVTQEGFANWVSMNLPIITVAMVQGDALGGGFEAALSSNLIVAERSARFGLPETLFSLFPGMGAFSFLARRTTPATAQRMIMSGRIYTGEELFDLGVVDILAEDGEAEAAFHDYVAKNVRRHAASRAIIKSRQRFHPLTLEEMRDIADLWVDTAMSLTDRDLRKMERLVAAQDRRREKDVARE